MDNPIRNIIVIPTTLAVGFALFFWGLNEGHISFGVLVGVVVVTCTIIIIGLVLYHLMPVAEDYTDP